MTKIDIAIKLTSLCTQLKMVNNYYGQILYSNVKKDNFSVDYSLFYCKGLENSMDTITAITDQIEELSAELIRLEEAEEDDAK